MTPERMTKLLLDIQAGRSVSPQNSEEHRYCEEVRKTLASLRLIQRPQLQEQETPAGGNNFMTAVLDSVRDALSGLTLPDGESIPFDDPLNTGLLAAVADYDFDSEDVQEAVGTRKPTKKYGKGAEHGGKKTGGQFAPKDVGDLFGTIEIGAGAPGAWKPETFGDYTGPNPQGTQAEPPVPEPKPEAGKKSDPKKDRLDRARKKPWAHGATDVKTAGALGEKAGPPSPPPPPKLSDEQRDKLQKDLAKEKADKAAKAAKAAPPESPPKLSDEQRDKLKKDLAKEKFEKVSPFAKHKAEKAAADGATGKSEAPKDQTKPVSEKEKPVEAAPAEHDSLPWAASKPSIDKYAPGTAERKEIERHMKNGATFPQAETMAKLTLGKNFHDPSGGPTVIPTKSGGGPAEKTADAGTTASAGDTADTGAGKKGSGKTVSGVVADDGVPPDHKQAVEDFLEKLPENDPVRNLLPDYHIELKDDPTLSALTDRIKALKEKLDELRETAQDNADTQDDLDTLSPENSGVTTRKDRDAAAKRLSARLEKQNPGRVSEMIKAARDNGTVLTPAQQREAKKIARLEGMTRMMLAKANYVESQAKKMAAEQRLKALKEARRLRHGAGRTTSLVWKLAVAAALLFLFI